MVQTSRGIYIPSFWRRRFSVDGFTSGDERQLPVGQDLGRSRVQRLQHTSFDRLHVNIASGLDTRVAQSPLRILQCPVMLKMSTQRSAHHLKRDEPVRDTKLSGNRPDPPIQEVL